MTELAFVLTLLFTGPAPTPPHTLAMNMENADICRANGPKAVADLAQPGIRITFTCLSRIGANPRGTAAGK